MAGRTYLKVAFSISIFFVATGWAGAAAETIYLDTADGPYASNPIPADGAVIPGSPMRDDIYTTLDFTPGDGAVSHEAFFSDDPTKVTARDPCVSLGPPPYGGYRYYVGLYAVEPYTESLVRGTKYYWCVDETDSNNVVWEGPVWSFYLQDYKAFDPSPPDEATFVETDVLLCWSEPVEAQEYDVYIGTDWNDVNNAPFPDPNLPPYPVFLGTVSGTCVQVTGLAFETKYYWRVDTVSGRLPQPLDPGTIYKGDVWCFTTVPEGLGTIRLDLWWNIISPPPIIPPYPDPNPDETRFLTSFNSGEYLGENYGGQIHGWLHPRKSGDYTFWLCTDDDGELFLSTDDRPANMQLIASESSWTNPFTWKSGGEEQSAPIPLVGGRKYYIMARWTEYLGGDHCMVAWQGPDQPHAPVDGSADAVIPGSRLSPFEQFWAYDPDPCDGQAGVALPVTLRWEPGDNATEHNVYIGSNFNDVKNAIYRPAYPPPAVFLATTTEPNILVTGLALDTQYYWRVDEFPPPMPPPWPSGLYYKGDVWNFTTEGQRIFVDMDAAGAEDGTSWENAYNFLQDALADANSLEKPIEICVAQGIYKPDQGSGQTPGDRTATFKLISGVTLKGGYAGFGEKNPNARDIELYETILSGDLDGNDVDVNDPADLLDEPTRAENSYHVVSGSGTDANAILEGFTIIGGNANGSEPEYFGGGMYNDSGSPTVVDCTFIGNSADRWGGGLCCTGIGMPTIKNCTFSVNQASDGGGITCDDNSYTKVTGCVFQNNVAETDGGGMHCIGGSNLTINKSILSNNKSHAGGGICCTVESRAVITGCVIKGNSVTGPGGGIFCDAYGRVEINNCLIVGNSSDWYGGGICCRFNGGAILTNCILWENTPDELGGSASVLYSDVYGGWPGLGNIGEDPCFADPCNGDYHLKSQAGRWDPNSQSWVLDDVTSPCIDAGNPGCPVGDEPSPNGNRRNMGAYGGTAEASKSPANWRSIADMTNDWVVDSNDLRVYVDYWLESGQCLPSDFDRSQFVDFDDFAILGLHWSYPSALEPGITYQIEKCDPNSFRSLATEPATETRFSVIVEGSYIHFKDMMVANCCPDELGLVMVVEDNLITIYETEYTPGGCWCICDYPITATLGPFEPGIYTLEVYEQWSGFIGSATVIIEPPE